MADSDDDVVMQPDSDGDSGHGSSGSGSDSDSAGAGAGAGAGSAPGKRKGKGKGKGGARAPAKPKKLPHWKRVNKRATDLYSLSLAAIAADPKTVLATWPATVEEENKLLMAHSTARKRDNNQVKQDIISATLKAGTLGPGTCSMSFFRPEMTSLSLANGPTLSADYAVEIVKRCPNLQSINVSGCFLVMDHHVRAMLDTCKGLRSLAVQGCRMLTDTTLDNLVAFSPKLDRIDIGGCFNLTFPAVHRFITTHPNLANCVAIDISGTRFSDDTVAFIAKNCPNLLELGIGYSDVANDTFSLVCQSCRMLRKARVHWCQQLGDDCIGQLATMLDLEYVDMQGCRGVSAMAIAHLVYMRAPKRTEMDAPNRLLTYLNARFAANFDHETSEGIKDLHPALKFVYT